MSDSRSAGSTVAGASHAAAATPLVVLALAVLLLIAACSHDAPRQNPLDPELTPAVELQAALDDSAGTVTLSWTPYSGPQPFAACYVQRRVQGQEAWADLDTLLTAAEPGFVDSSLAPATAYEYRVVVVNAGGYQAPSNRESVAGYSVGAVELLAPEPVPDSGLVRLRWTRYRDPGFQAYRLLRRPVGSDRDTTLFVSAARGDTVAVDTDAFHQVTYTYRVQVEGPGQALVSNAREARLDLRAVPLRPLVLDPSTATARLAWSAYSGPRFDSYVVERRAEGFEPTVVRVLGDRAMTTAADTLPLGDTRYLYRVVVHTTRGEEVAGPELSGIIYRHVADLPLDLAAGDYVRLYAELDGRVAALVAGARGIRLRFYGSGGRQEEQVLYTVAVDRPRTVSTAHGDPGVRLVSVAFDTVLALLHYDLDGQLLRQYDPLDFGQPLGPLTSDQQQVAPVVTLVSGVSDNYSSTVWVDAVTVSRDGQVLWQEGFDASPAGAAPWFYLGSEVTVSGGFARYSYRAAGLDPSASVPVARWGIAADPDWRDITVESEVTMTREGLHTVQLGRAGGSALGSIPGISGPYPSVLSLTADRGRQEIAYLWQYIPPRLSDGRQVRLSVPALLLPGLPYGWVLGVREDAVEAGLRGPVSTLFYPPSAPVWAALAALTPSQIFLSIDGDLHDAAYEHPHPLLALGSLDISDISEVRLQPRSSSLSLTGFCVPAEHKVHTWRSAQTSSGFYLIARDVAYGKAVGSEAGELLYPLSFDWRPGGGAVVLDAGNGRIQVFDASGEPVVHWGGRGSAAGRFDFGRGSAPEDFAGSLCVGADGDVYVADVGNDRIQVFAP